MAVNVLDYGADPTGLSDSLVAFRAAYDAYPGGDYLIPPGFYKISDQVHFNKPVNVRTEGARRTTVVFPPGASQASFAIADLAGSGTAIRGLTFDGSAETTLRYNAVRIGSAANTHYTVPEDIALEDLFFKGISGTAVMVRTGRNVHARDRKSTR